MRKKALGAGFILFLTFAFSTASAGGPHAPIIFAHGLGISGKVYEDLFSFRRVFAKRGYTLYIAETPVHGTVEQRAEVLEKEIERLVPTGKFHLIGHSMGGLDARLAIDKYGLGDRVLSLTTLSTPHHGSPIADFVVRHFGGAGVAHAKSHALLNGILGGDIQSAEDLTTESTAKFNAETPNDPRVEYFSMGFYIPEPVEIHTLALWFWVTHDMIEDAGEGQNDGLVSARSAEWGTYLGTMRGDHYSETSPIPLIGGDNYHDILDAVMDNLDREFP